MKKILPLLEKYVQWCVLGVGVLFVAYIAYLYLAGNPASKTIKGVSGQQVVGPGNVDTVIKDMTDQLDGRMKQVYPLPIPINIPTSFSTAVTTRPSAQNVTVAWDAAGFDTSQIATAAQGNSATKGVAALPTLPALQYVDQEPLRTILPGNSPTEDRDVDTATTFWKLPVIDFSKAFSGAFTSAIPPSQQNVLFVRATITRQEQDDSGAWGNDVVVSQAMLAPAGGVPYPDSSKPTFKDDGAKYHDWLAGLTGTNLSSNWPVAAAFPTVAPNANRPELQWQTLENWIPFRANRAGINAAVLNPAPGAAPGGAGNFNPAAPLVGRGILQPPAGRGRGGPAPQAAAPVAPGAIAPLAVAPVVPKFQPVPATAFSPDTAAAQGDMLLWFVDMDVQPGRTYRYKVRYTIYNPIFAQPNMAGSPALADVFGIDSADSEWSGAVVIPPRTEFWMSNTPPLQKKPQANFTVFTWHEGIWLQKDYTALGVGDEIGQDEPGKANFQSHWTLLEVQTNGENRTVMLVPDGGGTVQRRDSSTDANSQDEQRFIRTNNPQLQLAPSAPGAAVAPPVGRAPVAQPVGPVMPGQTGQLPGGE